MVSRNVALSRSAATRSPGLTRILKQTNPFLKYPDPFCMTWGINPGTGNPGFVFPSWNLLLPDLRRLNIRKNRVQLSWDSIEITPGNYNFIVLDDIVGNCNANNIELIFPIRGAPAQYLTVQTSNEPHFQPDPDQFAKFCSIIATRYDGYHGFGHIDRIQITNEESNIANTDPAYNVTLQTDIPSGTNNITSFNITAIGGGKNILVGAVIQFGAFGGGGQTVTVSQIVLATDTIIHVQSFNSNQHYIVGSTIAVQYAVTNATSSVYWGAATPGGLVTNANKYKPNRDPQFYWNLYLKALQAIRNVSNVPVEMGAMFWLQPANDGIYAQPLSQMATFLNFLYSKGLAGKLGRINWHYYSNAVSDIIGNNQVVTIGQLINELTTSRNNAGDNATMATIGEFGWQIPTDVPDSDTQWQQYFNLLEAARQSSLVNEVSFFTLGYTANFASGSSLTSLDAGVVSYRQPTFNNLADYIAQHPRSTWN
jgi:hypothetical protein